MWMRADGRHHDVRTPCKAVMEVRKGLAGLGGCGELVVPSQHNLQTRCGGANSGRLGAGAAGPNHHYHLSFPSSLSLSSLSLSLSISLSPWSGRIGMHQGPGALWLCLYIYIRDIQQICKRID